MNFFKRIFQKETKSAPVPEKTPLREYQMTELMGRAITVGEKSYVPVHACIYEDSLFFEFDVHEADAADQSSVAKQSFTFPINENRLAPITFEGIEFYWDLQDDAFRWHPRKTATEVQEVNADISVCDNGEFRVAKTYAEQNLSQKALAYAYKADDNLYYWNMADSSHYPVIYEIPGVFSKYLNTDTLLDPNVVHIVGQIAFYNNSYSVDEPTDFKEIFAKYKQRYEKTLSKTEA